jgi:hypothetical protein
MCPRCRIAPVSRALSFAESIRSVFAQIKIERHTKLVAVAGSPGWLWWRQWRPSRCGASRSVERASNVFANGSVRKFDAASCRADRCTRDKQRVDRCCDKLNPVGVRADASRRSTSLVESGGCTCCVRICANLKYGHRRRNQSWGQYQKCRNPDANGFW